MGVTAVGNAVIVRVALTLLDGEKLSMTVSLTVYVPAFVKVWDGFWVVVIAEPSPKFHL